MLDAAIEIAREAVATGVVTPRIVAERALAQLDRILALAPDGSPAMLPWATTQPSRSGSRPPCATSCTRAHARFRDVVRDEYLPASTRDDRHVRAPGR